MTRAKLLEQLIAAHEQVGMGLSRTAPDNHAAFGELAVALREMADTAEKLAKPEVQS